MMCIIKDAYNNGLYIEWYQGGSDGYRYSLIQSVFRIMRKETCTEYKPVASYNVKLVTVYVSDKMLRIVCEGICFDYIATEDDEIERRDHIRNSIRESING